MESPPPFSSVKSFAVAGVREFLTGESTTISNVKSFAVAGVREFLTGESTTISNAADITSIPTRDAGKHVQITNLQKIVSRPIYLLTYVYAFSPRFWPFIFQAGS